VDRRPRWRSYLSTATTFLVAASSWAATTALGELLSGGLEPWLAGVVGAVLAFAGVLWLVAVRHRPRRARARPATVTDPQLVDLLRELMIEQARFDQAMLEKSR